MRALRLCLVGVIFLGACGDDSVERAEPESTETLAEETSTTRERRTTTTGAPEEGTRRNPLPFGETAAVSIGESDPAWTIQVLEFKPDGTDVVLAENPFNEPPAEGRQFAIVRVRAEYMGHEEPATLFSDLNFVAVDASNLTYDSDDDCGVVPDEVDAFGEVYAGGVVEGNLCWSVSSEHIDSLLLGISTLFGSGPPYFMALS